MSAFNRELERLTAAVRLLGELENARTAYVAVIAAVTEGLEALGLDVDVDAVADINPGHAGSTALADAVADALSADAATPPDEPEVEEPKPQPEHVFGNGDHVALDRELLAAFADLGAGWHPANDARGRLAVGHRDGAFYDSLRRLRHAGLLEHNNAAGRARRWALTSKAIVVAPPGAELESEPEPEPPAPRRRNGREAQAPPGTLQGRVLESLSLRADQSPATLAARLDVTRDELRPALAALLEDESITWDRNRNTYRRLA